MLKFSKYFFTLIYFLNFEQLYSQFYKNNQSGLQIGALISVGNKIQRVGVSINSYYFKDFVQFNGGIKIYRNFKNLGPSGEYNELVMSAGVVFAAGRKDNDFNPFISSYSNQTFKKYSLAYSYNAYFNKIKTTQQTGIVALQFDKFTIISENDLLARQTLDRYRTGAFLFQFQYKNILQAGFNCSLWTGKMGHEIRNNKNYPYVGYLDTTNGNYSTLSHGLLSVQIKVNVGSGQNFQSNLGIDAEQVRHFVQNRLIHDQIFLPAKWNKQINCHIPMIDSDGNQYLYRENQKIKGPSLYWNFSSNSAAFY